jgi:hypothetical protein
MTPTTKKNAMVLKKSDHVQKIAVPGGKMSILSFLQGKTA